MKKPRRFCLKGTLLTGEEGGKYFFTSIPSRPGIPLRPGSPYDI